MLLTECYWVIECDVWRGFDGYRGEEVVHVYWCIGVDQQEDEIWSVQRGRGDMRIWAGQIGRNYLLVTAGKGNTLLFWESWVGESNFLGTAWGTVLFEES